jgi:hypothetical protein
MTGGSWIQSRYSSGQAPAPGRRGPKTAITVRQAITQWLEVAELEVTTRERYDDLIRLYILPALGDILTPNGQSALQVIRGGARK